MKQYLDLIDKILAVGDNREDRTGTGTLSIFGHQMRFDLQRGFPLVTTKRIHIRSVFVELLWFLRGDTNVKYLHEHGVRIWDEWADEKGNLGLIYGHQWRHWAGVSYRDEKKGVIVDQIALAIDRIKKDPNSRRHIVSSWNIAEIAMGEMALPPCHVLFQFYVAQGRLSCQLYQRSADSFLGLPFNIASYALLTHLVAQQCDLGVGDLVWTGGDVHVYKNHIKQANLQLTRDPLPLPKLQIERKPDSIFEYEPQDIKVINYKSHPHIKAEVSV